MLIMLMEKGIKQFFCRHDYMRTADKMVQEGKYIRMRAAFRCRKCGKVVYR